MWTLIHAKQFSFPVFLSNLTIAILLWRLQYVESLSTCVCVCVCFMIYLFILKDGRWNSKQYLESSECLSLSIHNQMSVSLLMPDDMVLCPAIQGTTSTTPRVASVSNTQWFTAGLYCARNLTQALCNNLLHYLI